MIETGSTPVASVIWLHGLGADGHDFEPIVPELRLPTSLPLRFVFPHAPFRPVTWNNGYVMRAWYDIAMTEQGFYQNPEHLREAVATTQRYIAAEEARGFDAARIVVAGFSQGGAVALRAGLHYAKRLAGILCLSAPLPYQGELLAGIDPANADVPVFLAHGEQDAVVPHALGRQARERLAEAGAVLEWHSYPGLGHGVDAQEIRDISAWLVRVLK